MATAIYHSIADRFRHHLLHVLTGASRLFMRLAPSFWREIALEGASCLEMLIPNFRSTSPAWSMLISIAGSPNTRGNRG
jgi:hypothetical protein